MTSTSKSCSRSCRWGNSNCQKMFARHLNCSNGDILCFTPKYYTDVQDPCCIMYRLPQSLLHTVHKRLDRLAGKRAIQGNNSCKFIRLPICSSIWLGWQGSDNSRPIRTVSPGADARCRATTLAFCCLQLFNPDDHKYLICWFNLHWLRCGELLFFVHGFYGTFCNIRVCLFIEFCWFQLAI